jgi:aspartate--ammonia ligase
MPVRVKMPELVVNENYKSMLSLRETETAIKFIKDTFEEQLSNELNLQRISSPFFLRKGSGINDDLNGVEKKVSFQIPDAEMAEAECLFSLAKWKRMALAEYGFEHGEGLYTDMNALRPQEVLDNIHSIYVDQWDWERVISKEERHLDFLKEIVRKIYNSIKSTEKAVCERFTEITPLLPKEIVFIHTEDLAEKYPDLTPRARENKIAREYGAVFIIGIGAELSEGILHDGRAPDYDDWITLNENGKRGLNGDIFVWNSVLQRGFELSSMGIRVDKESLIEQLRVRNSLERAEQEWHKRLLNDEFPLTIGGGIGQSRLCMFYLQKIHIGEVHASIWPDETVKRCKEAGIRLL